MQRRVKVRAGVMKADFTRDYSSIFYNLLQFGERLDADAMKKRDPPEK
jgi:hypothetical protein